MSRFSIRSNRHLPGVALWLICILSLQLLAPITADATTTPETALQQSDTPSQTVTDNGADGADAGEKEAQDEPDSDNDGSDTGNDGTDGTESEQPATVDTGDAVSGATVENTINTNTTETAFASDLDASSTHATPTPATDTAAATGTDGTTATSGTDAFKDTDTTPASTTATGTDAVAKHGTSSADRLGTTTVTNTNVATTSNHVSSTAATGGNTVSGGGGSAAVTTGDAIAYADVLNVVNTNVTDSRGLIDFISGVLGYEHFDLRDDFALTFEDLVTAWSTPACALDVCESSGTRTVINDNTADLENYVNVVARTGGNTASGSAARISTGDAYASANVVNVANTNITDSNYLLLTFNNFADYGGDVVLPNASFFSRLFARGAGSVPSTVVNTNRATVTNAVTSTADSGGNTASGSSATITTGDAVSSANALNHVNKNLVGGGEFSMLIRVHGDWTGDVFGLPDGMSWERTPGGVRLYQTGTGAPTRRGADVVRNENTARVHNDVSVYALTGDNRASGAEAAVETGTAIADANLTNVVNTNVVGSNWASLVFNIYGNWNGNLAFGQPDLWLGLEASSPDSTIRPGSPVTYTYTLFNRGDSPASDLAITSHFATGSLAYDADRVHRLDTLAPGDTHEFSVSAAVPENLGGSGEVPIPLKASVTSRENDGNPDDNEDTVTIYAQLPEDDDDDEINRRPTIADANFEISKDANYATATPGTTIDYTITLVSTGAQLYDSVLVDTITDETGAVLYEQTWPLQTIVNGEEIKIEYSLELPASMATGTYTNTAQLHGLHRSMRRAFQEPYSSPVATHDLAVLGNAASGTVAGISTTNAPTQCRQYLTDYLRRDLPNDPVEVAKLQSFLNAFEDKNLRVSGIFDAATEAAVRAYQQRYRAEVLEPWGMTRDSGFVYYTTQRHINERFCHGERRFPLSPEQRAEINTFKATVETEPFPERENPPIGAVPSTASSTFASRDTDDEPDTNDDTAAPPIPSSETDVAGSAGNSSNLLSSLRTWLWSLVTPLLAEAWYK